MRSTISTVKAMFSARSVAAVASKGCIVYEAKAAAAAAVET
jgi:hypothetical protein